MAPQSKSIERALSLADAKGADALGLVLDGKAIENGVYVPRKDAQSAPTITLPTSLATNPGPYLLIALDLDAPFKSLPVLGPILHWVQSDVTTAANTLQIGNTAPIAFYIGPAPPPGAAPHRYVFFLYAQPDGFDTTKFMPAGGKPIAVTKRMFYNLATFEKEAGLGEVLAAGYFLSN